MRRERPGPEGASAPTPQPPVPEKLWESAHFWFLALGLWVASMVVSALTTRIADLPAPIRSQLEDAVADASTGGAEMSLDTVFAAAMAMSAVFAVGLGAIGVWFVFRMLKGRLWARVCLDFSGILLLVFAVTAALEVFNGNLASSAVSTPAWTFVSIGCQVLSGLCAGVAMWRCRSDEATTFFVESRRDRTR